MATLQHPIYISLSALAKSLPAFNGRSVSAPTCFRWATRGIRGHLLRTIRIGGRSLTTLEDYERFASAIESGPAPLPPPAPSTKQVKRARDAQAVLQAAGIAS